jgi:glycosyltransferase involved in cell wall biosynthesis
MPIVAVTTVKNEIDIIEAFVRHTLALVDRLVVLDNGSGDGTLTVLRALQAEGLPLDVVEDPTPGMYQAQRMTRLMRDWAVGRHGADWVLPLDADEFLVVPRRGSLVPSGARADRPVALPWQTYVPCREDDGAEANPVVRIRHRLREELGAWVKVLVPGELARRADATFSQGSHDLLLDGKPCPQVAGDGACLAHFPLRSPGQYLAKIAMNTLQYLVIPDRRPEGGWHYREAYDVLRRDPRAFLGSFHEAARRYCCLPGSSAEPETVYDPLAHQGGPLRHTPAVDDELRGWLAVLDCAEQMARRQAPLVAALDEQNRIALDRLAATFTTIHANVAEQFKQALTWHGHLAQAQEQMRHLHQQAQQVHEQAQQVHRQAHAAQVQAQQQLAEELRRRQALEQSWSWQIGRLIVGPMRPVKRVAAACRRAVRRYAGERGAKAPRDSAP